MTNLIGVEIRRYLARPLLRWLIALAVLGCVLAGVIALREAGPIGGPDEFRLAELWVPAGDSLLGLAAFLLPSGAVVGGASMVGAEWRAGTFVTLLTWQPGRVRVAVAKIVACGLVATVVAVLLQVLFCAVFLPAALARGTMDGVDAEWLRALVAAVGRIAAITGLAAILMGSIAMMGRNTAAALGAAFGYLMIGENLVRAWKPWSSRFLLGENSAIFVTGADLATASFTRSTLTAALTLTGYAALAGILAVTSFARRDLASAS